jgi:hypothetical protein
VSVDVGVDERRRRGRQGSIVVQSGKDVGVGRSVRACVVKKE